MAWRWRKLSSCLFLGELNLEKLGMGCTNHLSRVAQFVHFVLACIDVHRRRRASFAVAQAVNNVHL